MKTITIDTPYKDKTKKCIDCFSFMLGPNNMETPICDVLTGECLQHGVPREMSATACAFFQEWDKDMCPK